jgi:hypothetical protein
VPALTVRSRVTKAVGTDEQECCSFAGAPSTCEQVVQRFGLVSNCNKTFFLKFQHQENTTSGSSGQKVRHGARKPGPGIPPVTPSTWA